MTDRSGFHHLSIDYDEGVPGSYRAVVLKKDGQEVNRFGTGDPQADWAAYLTHARDAGLQVLESSSVTHFVFDNVEWRFVMDDTGREILVPEDRPEWLEDAPDV